MIRLIVILFSLPTIILSQDLGLINGFDARHFQLKNLQDTVNFIKVNGNIDTVKPVLIFCQGSQPIPLLINENGSKFITSLSNFNYHEIAKKVHLIILSMPNTPLEADVKTLNKQYGYVSDTSQQHSYSKAYLASNYADNYIRRVKDVIDFLYNQKWVDKKKIILLGHSQGSKIAIQASINNNKVYCVGFVGGNPLGRIDQLIREQRYLAKEGKITKEESQKQIDSIYKMWEEINKTPDAITTEFGDPNKTWTSFSKPFLNDLLNLNKPLFVAYGTEDVTATFCDLLPLYFITEHKSNLTLKPYVGLEHNFFEIDTNEKPIYSKGHWNEVIQDFIIWTNK